MRHVLTLHTEKCKEYKHARHFGYVALMSLQMKSKVRKYGTMYSRMDKVKFVEDSL